MPTPLNIDAQAESAPLLMRSEPCSTCCCCGSVGVPLYSDLPDNLFSAPGTWDLKRCAAEGCGMVWLDPMPLPADLHHAYKDYYTHLDTISSSPLFRFFKGIYLFLLNAVLMLGGIPAERKRAALMFLGKSPPGRLLDVGCGKGDFLALMAKRGWSVMGIDFDAEAVEAARTIHGLDVRVGTVDTMIALGEKFDVLTASHVIEHVIEPLEFLERCRGLLRPGGRMVLRTPNIDSLGHRRYRRFWRGLEPPRHLHLFTAAALRGLASSAGFAQANIFTSSVASENMLTASHILEKTGRYPSIGAPLVDQMKFKMLRPYFGLRGKLAWLLDRSSGEEICAVLTNAESVAIE